MIHRRTLVNLAVIAFCLLVIVAASAFAFVQIRDMQTQTRGVAYLNSPSIHPQSYSPIIGVNASLEQYSDEQLTQVLALIRNGHFSAIRQHFYWNEIEPRKGEFDWGKWDRIVARIGELPNVDTDIVAVLDTTPVWARDPGEADLLNAPPRDVNDYTRFVSAFVAHYSKQIRYIQIWDNPNVHPFWGRRNADPIEYTVLLRAGAVAARSANPNVVILSAGLAANSELIREHPDYSDVLFLRGMYDAGAKDYFDIVAAKPYGMWSGPDDRRVDMGVFNFSRAILLRDEMVAHGDANKPIWAVEFGWNTLPADWKGAPSPWGSDTDAIQSKRLADAIQRAKSEWAWMGGMFVQTFQPNAPSDDPQWGFALVDRNFQPRSLYASASSAILAPVQPASFDFTRFYFIIGVLGIVALVALWQATIAARKILWSDYWRAVESRFAVLPESVQFISLALAVIAFYYSPNVLLNSLFLLISLFLFTLRLDLGLAITVFTIPFYLLPKNLIGGAQFSLVEILTLTAVLAFALRVALNFRTADRRPMTAYTLGSSAVSRLRSSDWAILFFVLLGILSVALAANFGVANREFRVIVLEPALLYALIRFGNFPRRDLRRLIDAFILSAVAISLIGLYQYIFTNYVIVGEGVRRVLAVYGSPNNLALYLDRALPLVMALWLFSDGRLEVAATPSQSRPSSAGNQPAKAGFVQSLKRIHSPRLIYTLAAIPIALCLYLTYSRGAWLGIIAGLAIIGMFSARRIRFVVIALLVIGAILIIPFLQTERAQSLFQEGTGTGFFRVSVWQSAIEMIRDHPIFGVGLDNFLYEYPKYIQPGAWREPNLSHPHNIVLDFWVRLGIGGVIVLAWMVIEFFWREIRELKQLRGNQRALVIGLMASMTAALAHGMIDAAYFYVDLAFVFMLIFGVSVQLHGSKVE